LENYEVLRIAHGQRAQHDGVDQAEDCGIGSDAEGERNDCEGGKAGTLAQHAQAVADILKQTLHGDPRKEVGLSELK